MGGNLCEIRARSARRRRHADLVGQRAAATAGERKRNLGVVNSLAGLAAALLVGASPVHAIADDTRGVPPRTVVDRSAKAAARVATPEAVRRGVVRIYRDTVPWFGENRDVATFISLGKVRGFDLFIHPLRALALGIPAGTKLVLISSNGEGVSSASTTQNSSAAQRSLEAFVRRGGNLIVDMGDNDPSGGYFAPGATGTPDYIFPNPCNDATFTAAATRGDAHRIVRGPDRRRGTADDLNDSNIDMPDSCSVAHGNLEQGITLPRNATRLLTATFDGTQKAILAEYRLGRGLVVLDTVTKEFVGQNPPGRGPSLFMRNLFAYALAREPT
jgi:hypothetical protein